MKTLILSLILLSNPVAHGTDAGLICKIDPKNSKDPYGKMKKDNENKIQESINRMGVKVNGLTRLEMMKGLNFRLEQLCKNRDSVNLAAAAIPAATGSLDCGAYEGLSTKMKTFDTNNKSYQAALKQVLDEQKTRFNTLIEQERRALGLKISQTSVRTSYRSAWGRDMSQPDSIAIRKQGIISERLLQIEKEIKISSAPQGRYNDLTKSLDSLKTKCPSLGGNKEIMASAKKPDGFGTALDGDLNKDGKVDDLDKNYFPPAPGEGGGGGAGVDTTGGGGGGDTIPPPKDTLLGPVNDSKGGGIGEWASRNKGALMLGAGTAAVVGGVLWYKNKKDKEKEEAEAELYSPLDTSTSTSITTSTVTNTITDTNGFSLSVSGFPQSAIVGQKIGTIVVSVSGPDGHNTDGVPVTLACTYACPISGTLSKTISGGKAEFNDISFSAEKNGVQLRVTAPGLNSVASPGSFSVTQP